MIWPEMVWVVRSSSHQIQCPNHPRPPRVDGFDGHLQLHGGVSVDERDVRCDVHDPSDPSEVGGCRVDASDQ